MSNQEWPKVSIVIATLNAKNVLPPCIQAIQEQDYPQEKIEIVVGDGGSTDGTQEFVEKHNAKVVFNPLKTAEAGKAVAVRASTGDLIAIIDSDNIMPTKNWLKEMVKPLLENPSAVGSEPWEYTWRKEDSFITRYSALIGMNDPFVHFLGNYDRINLLTGKWTEVPHEEEDKGEYLLVTLDKRGLPTIGANGTVFRADYLKKELVGDYLFDVDILSKTIKQQGSLNFIKVKNGIVHTFCEGDISKFARKQRRRIQDFLFHKFIAKDREFEWEAEDASGQGRSAGKGSIGQVVSLFFTALKNNIGMLKFLLSCIAVVPLLYQTVKGFLKKPDVAWFFHPLACEITLYEYARGTLLGMFKKEELNREGWGQ
jgi:glycosyltransferase involved in cell wall biosynthesis